MIVSEQGILINKFNYSESSLILKIYTKNKGLVTLMHKGAKKKKHASHQPLCLINSTFYYKESSDMHLVKELSVRAPYQTIYSDVLKSSVALFLQEVLYKSIKEEQPNDRMFEFIETFFKKFDLGPFNPNLHLWFLIKLMEMIGIEPNFNSRVLGQSLSLKEGVFTSKLEIDDHLIPQDTSSDWQRIQGTKFAAIDTLDLNKAARRQLLSVLVKYLEIQLELKKGINSHLVLKELLE